MLVKMFSVQALETVRTSPEGVNAEVWRTQARNTNLALVGIRYDVILRSLLRRRSGDDERDPACEINTFGAKRLSSNVERSILRQQGQVENMNKELCGLVRCFRIYLREKAKMENDATQRQRLQVIVSAQGAARRDRRFQAEHAEHGKIRTQCKRCSACDRQSGKTRRRDQVTRHSIRSLDTAEGSQTARRRYLELWLTKHITAFQKTSRREEAAYRTRYKSRRHCERFEVQQVAVRETDTVKPGRGISNRRLESMKTWLREAGLNGPVQMMTGRNS